MFVQVPLASTSAPKRDYNLIGKIAGGSIPLETAQECFDLVIDSKQSARTFDLRGFDEKERTAYLHAAEFEQLAEWRVSGWPSECFVCGQTLRIWAFSWFVCEAPSGETTVVHISCLGKATEMEKTGCCKDTNVNP